MSLSGFMFTATCNEPDDGSYNYAWAWQASPGATIDPASQGTNHCKFSSTASMTAGSYFLTCVVTDKNGNVVQNANQSCKVTVTA